MRINSKKVRKILRRIWTAPKRTFETFCTQETLDASAWMQHSQLFIWFRKIEQRIFFLYYIFVKKNKCWKNFKITRKLLFSYSFYSHLEIGNFRVWHTSARDKCMAEERWIVKRTPPATCATQWFVQSLQLGCFRCDTSPLFYPVSCLKCNLHFTNHILYRNVLFASHHLYHLFCFLTLCFLLTNRNMTVEVEKTGTAVGFLDPECLCLTTLNITDNTLAFCVLCVQCLKTIC
jgi:hypothetical protein